MILFTHTHTVTMALSWLRQRFQHSNGIVSVFVVLITITLGTVFYIRGQELMSADIQNHLESLALRASLLVEPAVLDTLRTPEDAYKPAYEQVIQTLNTFRTEHPEVRFVYILRPTKNVNTFTFVADADSLHPFPPYYDLNNDGVIDESDELAPPGKKYDVSEQPKIQQAITEPTVSDEPYSDQWGAYMSAYAPIPGHGEYETLVVGVDMDIAKYRELSKSLVTPSLLTLIFVLGVILGTIVFIEIAQKKIQSERKLESDRSILLHLTTHQLGTPIATLRWWLEILRDRDRATFGEKDAVIDELELGMLRIESIMKQLSKVNVVEAKDFFYNAEVTIIETLIHDIVANTKKMYDLRQQTLTVTSARNLPEIRIDRRLIGGVIQEVIENASCYSQKGNKVDLQVSADERWISIVITDHGIGIPESDLPYITEKFRRGTNASSIKSVGSGLGLHIAKVIIKKAEGELLIESTKGKGTSVTIKLPIR